MAEEAGPKMSFQGLTAGAAFIIVALAILIGWGTGDWWMMFPALLLGFGAFGILMGAAVAATERTNRYAKADSSYAYVWGSLLALLGMAWLINGVIPNIAPLIIVMLFLFIGAVILVLSYSKMRGKK
jgi:uncharacterized membrane protein YoaK (UPF0700 family)